MQFSSTIQTSAAAAEPPDVLDCHAGEEDETTVAEQEEVEGSTDAQAELDTLQQKGLLHCLCLLYT